MQDVMPALVWFRSDLRVSDNTALHHACRASHDGVIGLFVIAPGQWKGHDWAPVRVDFVLRTLAELSQALAAKNIPLLIATAPTVADVVPRVLAAAHAHRCDKIHFNREYEIDEANRDAALESAARASGIATTGHADQTIVRPELLKTGDGGFYTIFSPFKRSWIKHLVAEGTPPILPDPRPQPKLDVSPDPVPESISGFSCSIPASMWPAGEAAAKKRLRWFASNAITDYKVSRDIPSLDGTSRLSPHLASGSVSPRQCLAAALVANAASTSPFDTGPAGIVQWISELIWREFYVAVMVGFPRVARHRAFKPATERIRWNDNPAHLQAWKAGQTGVPIVDAGMRQLQGEGWMHNRVRMITAMYFSKNLFLDWRLGEKHFMLNLIDGSLASNNGGWQWSASTGTDAAPYFRIFNPVTQSERFDEAGDYIRKWVPELARVQGDAIHDPSRLPVLLRSTLDYPDMLVDLSTSRAAAIEAFKAAP